MQNHMPHNNNNNSPAVRRDLFWETGPAVEAAQVAGWTIPEIVLRRMQREPERVVYAVPEGDGYRDVTWGEFGGMVAEAAAGLASLGIAPGDRVAIMGDACLDWVVGDYGVIAARAITVGIYQTSSVHEVAHILSDSRPRAFIAHTADHLEKAIAASADGHRPDFFILLDPQIPASAHADGARILTFAEVGRLGREARAADAARFETMVAALRPDDAVRIVYTSGTTGRPKGAVYQHGNWMLVGEQWVLRFPAIRESAIKTIAFLSPSHVSPAMLIEIAPLVSRLVPHFAPPGAALTDVFKVVRPNLIGMTPRFYQKLAVQLALAQNALPQPMRTLHRWGMRLAMRVVHGKWNGRPADPLTVAAVGLARRTLFRPLLATVGLDRVQRAQTGSAMMPVEVAALWASWGIDMREAYGITEAAFAICYQADPYPRPGTIGRPMTPQPGTEVKLAEDGELLVRSPMVFTEYWENPEATAKAIIDGWYHSGDLAEWTEHGDLRLIGRKNDAISTAGGKTINPAEIENELKLSPYISEAVVFGSGEKFLTALLEIEYEAVAAWAREKRIPVDGYAELVERPEVRQLLEQEVEQANGKLGRVQQIKKFRILPESLEHVPEALTSGRKVKRRVVRERYNTMIESMYDRSETDLLTAHAGLGRKGAR